MNKKYLLAVLSLLGVVFVIWFLWSKKNSEVVPLLEPTNLLAANIQFTDQLSQQGADSIKFYTGSALAQIELRNNLTLESKLITKNLPFESVKSVKDGGTIMAIKAYYDPGDSLLSLNLSQNKQLPGGDSWFLVDKNRGETTPLFNFTEKAISDVVVDGDDVYYLAVEANDKLSLSKISNSLSNNEVLVESVDSSVFIGARKGNLALRDLKGNIYKFIPGEGISKIGEKASEVGFDIRTGSIVIDESSQSLDAISEEGGIIKTSGNKLPLRIINIETGTDQQITLGGNTFFVSNGFVLALESLRQPSVMAYYNLVNNNTGVVTVDQSSSNIRDQIQSIIVMKDNLSRIAVITNFNQLLLYQTPGQPAPKDYRLPNVSDTLGDYGFNYDVGGNIATIYYSPSSRSIVEDSISELKASCKCDVNQVEKVWKPFATSPGL